MRATVRLTVFLAIASSFASGCAKASFASEDRAAAVLDDETTRLGARCDRWFVRECVAGDVRAVWFFRPRIDGPAETAAYDAASGVLLYQRQFGASSGWSFTPVRQYGSAPACRPELDSSGAESACVWIERRKAPASSSP